MKLFPVLKENEGVGPLEAEVLMRSQQHQKATNHAGLNAGVCWSPRAWGLFQVLSLLSCSDDLRLNLNTDVAVKLHQTCSCIQRESCGPTRRTR